MRWMILLSLAAAVHADLALSSRVVEVVRGNGTDGPYVLSRAPVVPNSLVLMAGDLRLPDAAYAFNPRSGAITLASALPEGDTIVASYLPVPLGLAPSYALRPLARAEDVASRDTLGGAAPVVPFAARRQGGLRLGGQKTFALTAGTDRDLDLEQGLSLDLSGTVARDVTVRGHLSDRAVPGTVSSRSVEELDRVFVEVRGTRADATLGDFDLAFGRTDLARFSRRLQGARAGLRTGVASIEAGAASSRGRFAVNRFQGVRGVQGPYALSGASGERNVSVLPGTDAVYLDGVPMARGAENDYVLEYERGAITFTPHRLITEYSRIEVEFLYSTTDYPRTFVAAQSDGAVADSALAWGVTVLREADDPFGPSARFLSDADRANLVAAGDDPDVAARDGGTYVGQGEGDFVSAVDSLGYDYYRYVGPDSGDYVVGFTFTGAGDYAYTGAGTYAYVGPGAGQYSAVVRPALPERRTTAVADLRAGEENWGVAVEAAVSELDRNVLSERDDSDNLSGAARGRLAISSRDVLGLDTMTAALRVRADGARFAAFGRLEDPDKERLWLLPSGSDSVQTLVVAAESRGAEGTAFSYSVGAGARGETGGASATRAQAGATWRHARARATASGTWVRSHYAEGSDDVRARRYDFTGEMSQGVSMIEPFAGVALEGVERGGAADSTSRSVEPRGGVRFQAGEWSGQVSASRRVDRVRAGGAWSEAARSTTYGAGTTRRGASFDGSASYSRRTSVRALPSRSYETSDLAALSADYHPSPRTVAVRADYQAITRRSESSIRTYVPVEPGEGDYSFENGEYVPDPEGDYVLVEEAGEGGTPVLEVQVSFTGSLEPWRKADASSLARFASFRLDAKVYEQTATTERARVLLLDPRAYQVPGLTVSGRTDVVGEVRFLPEDRDLDLRLRARRFDVYDASFDPRGETRLDESITATAVLRRGDTTVRGEAESGIVREGRRDRSAADATLVRFLAGVGREWPREVSLDVRAQLRFERDRVLPERVRMLSVIPRFERWLWGRGRLALDGRWDRVATGSGREVLPFALAEGNPPGDSYGWGAALTFDFGRDVTSTARYTGLSQPGRGTRHQARVEAVAEF